MYEREISLGLWTGAADWKLGVGLDTPSFSRYYASRFGRESIFEIVDEAISKATMVSAAVT
jgi:hypothetical protein